MRKGFKMMALVLCALISTSLVISRPAMAETLGFKAISAGGQHRMALDEKGKVWTWGINQGGQLGDGTTIPKPYRVEVVGLENIQKISAGGMHSVALDGQGKVWVWGMKPVEFNEGSRQIQYSPVQLSQLSDVKDISANIHTVVLKKDGTVWAWGLNDRGQLGDGSTNFSTTPVQVKDINEVIAVSAGGFHTLALLSDGTVWSWGDNTSGQLGTGSSDYFSTTPVQVADLSEIVEISAGHYFSSALKADGTVWTWGSNRRGQLGDQSTEERRSPVQVVGLDGIQKISAGVNEMMALDQEGQVWVWGTDWTRRNPADYDLGYEVLLSPKTVQGLTQVKEIASSSNYTVIASDGALLTWGPNYGLLGDGTANARALPGPVVDTILPEDARLSGADRIDTAIAISKKMMPTGQSADAVLIATSEDFPDALAGASLSGLVNAPLLLVDPNSDNEKTLKEIYRVLYPGGTIYILGGKGVVSDRLEESLRGNPYGNAVKRLAGENRYATAAAIAKEVSSDQGGEVIIATGENFPDSLAMSPYAAAYGIPMLLVEGNRIPDETLDYLKNLKPEGITLAGGEGVVSRGVEEKLKELFPEAELRRFGGANRYETSSMIAHELFGDSSSNLFVATGTNFPDALAGSVFAGSTESPIILVEQNQIPDEVSEYLSSLTSKKIVILGGQGAVSEDVYSGVKANFMK